MFFLPEGGWKWPKREEVALPFQKKFSPKNRLWHWRVPSHLLRKSSIWRAPIINGNICNKMTALAILTMLIRDRYRRFDNISYWNVNNIYIFGSYWLMILSSSSKTSAWWCIVHNDPTMLSTLDRPRSKLHRPHDDRASSNRHCGRTIINTLCFFNSLAQPFLFRTEVEKGYPKVLNHFMEQLL